MIGQTIGEAIAGGIATAERSARARQAFAQLQKSNEIPQGVSFEEYCGSQPGAADDYVGRNPRARQAADAVRDQIRDGRKVQFTPEQIARMVDGYMDVRHRITGRMESLGLSRSERSRFRDLERYIEYNLIATDVYFDISIPQLLPYGVERLTTEEVAQRFPRVVLDDNRDSGYFGAIYEGYRDDRWGDGQTLYVMANRGTDPSTWADIDTDIRQGGGRYTRQFELARNNAIFAIQGLPDGARLAFTGHSLGGALAQAQALYVGRDSHAYVFNSAGLHERYTPAYAQRDRDYVNSHVHAMNVRGEFLNGTQDRAHLNTHVDAGIGPWEWEFDIHADPIPAVHGDRLELRAVRLDPDFDARGYDFAPWGESVSFGDAFTLHGNLAIQYALMAQIDRLVGGRL